MPVDVLQCIHLTISVVIGTESKKYASAASGERMRRLVPRASDLAFAYTAGMLVFYPWLMRGYLDLSPFKLSMLLAFTLLCALAASFVLEERRITRPARPTLWILAWAGGTILSTLTSLSPLASVWSSEGYAGGLMLCLACLLGYLGVNAWLEPGVLPGLSTFFCLSGAGVSLLGILNNMGFDPLNVYAAIDPGQRNIFFSTIGNVDYLNSYVCLWLPVAAWRYLRSGDRLAMACAVVGFAGLALLDPGIASLGLAGALLLLLWCHVLSGAEAARLLLMAGFWLLAQFLMELLHRWIPFYMLERPLAVFGAPILALPGAALAFVLALWLRRHGPGNLLFQRLLVGICLLGTAGLFVWRNTIGSSLGGFDNFLLLNSEWATGRGALFADSLFLFRQAAPLRKLAGYGPGMFYRSLMASGDAVPYLLTDAIGAHNEYLDLLVCCGLLGCVLWLGVLISHLRFSLRCGKELGWGLGVFAYAVQAFFNNRVAAVFPLAILLLALMRVECRPADAPPSRRYLFAWVGCSALLLVVSLPFALWLMKPL